MGCMQGGCSPWGGPPLPSLLNPLWVLQSIATLRTATFPQLHLFAHVWKRTWGGRWRKGGVNFKGCSWKNCAAQSCSAALWGPGEARPAPGAHNPPPPKSDPHRRRRRRDFGEPFLLRQHRTAPPPPPSVNQSLCKRIHGSRKETQPQL